MPHGLLLFAHGARDAAWARPFEQARDHITTQHGPNTPVVLAFLEFMSPTLLQAGEQLAQQACDSVTVVPLFLGAGGHVRKDLPMMMAQLREQHPGTTWHLTQAVGETDTVVHALADAAWQLALATQANEGPAA